MPETDRMLVRGYDQLPTEDDLPPAVSSEIDPTDVDPPDLIFLPSADHPDIPLPTEDDLPFEDGRLHNYYEEPQSILLTTSIRPHLEEIHGDGVFLTGQDNGIYYIPTYPYKRSRCISPDWFYIPGVPQQRPNGRGRKSYCMWENEGYRPLIAIEYASNGGGEERDSTEFSGKFWIYETQIRPDYYVIYLPESSQMECYRLEEDGFRTMRENARGHYVIEEIGVEIGLWPAEYMEIETSWLRWWTINGVLLPTGEELAVIEQVRAESERLRAESERERAESERDRADAQNDRAESERIRAESERERAESERERAESERIRADEQNDRAESERERAESERERADDAAKAAVSERERAESERKRADDAAAKLAAMRAILLKMGVPPEDVE